MMSDAKQLTFFAEASRDCASPSPSRASKKASATLAISGLSSFDWSWCFGRAGWWWKTLAGLSGWRSTRVGLTWKARATPAGRRYFQLAVSKPRTSGSASGLWPTPQYHDHHPGDASRIGRHGTKHGDRNLNDWVAMLPTPDASLRPHEGNVRLLRAQAQSGAMTEDEAHAILGKSVWEAQGKIPAMLPTPRHEGFDAGGHRGKPDSLHAYAKMLPTPTVQDGENAAGPSTFQRNSLPLNAVAADGVAGMKLNPDWVIRMQGFPDHWLEVD